MTTSEDWLYSEERLEFRSKVLSLLLKRFPSEAMSSNSQSLYECAHDWVSQGNRTTHGLVAYYKAYYQ